MIQLDSFLQSHDISKVDFIKLDVEGFESDVLYGSANLISNFKPVIFMEFNSVTLTFETRISPYVFAESIWDIFDVYSINNPQGLVPVSEGDIWTFVLDNMIHHGCVEDVILKMKLKSDANTIQNKLQDYIMAN